ASGLVSPANISGHNMSRHTSPGAKPSRTDLRTVLPCVSHVSEQTTRLDILEAYPVCRPLSTAAGTFDSRGNVTTAFQIRAGNRTYFRTGIKPCGRQKAIWACCIPVAD